MSTKIEWTNETWNPIVGCSKISAGCQHCYAERMAKRLKAMGMPQYQDVVGENGWTGETVITEAMREPITWRKPRMIFVCSMSDLFHVTVPEHWIDEVMEVIKLCPQHTFQILTKRADRMAEYFSTHTVPGNVWLGVSAENQQAADERIPNLLKTKAKVRFVSVEPMLGPVDLTRIKWAKIPVDPKNYTYGAPAPDEMWSMRNALLSRPGDEYNKPLAGIDWVICGGESGPNARPMHPDWARGLRDQCQAAGVPFFFKQWGEWAPLSKQIVESFDNKTMTGKLIDGKTMVLCGKKAAGHMLDGVEWRQMPEA